MKETVKKEQEAKELDTIEALEKFLDGPEDSLSEEEELIK